MGKLLLQLPEKLTIADGAIEGEFETGKVSDGYHTFDELYEHRCVLFLALMQSGQAYAWKSRLHSDGTSFDGWFVAGIYTGKGRQITYHLPDKYWDECTAGALPKAPEWDGHTSADVLERIQKVNWSYR